MPETAWHAALVVLIALLVIVAAAIVGAICFFLWSAVSEELKGNRKKSVTQIPIDPGEWS